MGCKFSFKRVFLVASLALAGLFGISSILVNKQVQENPTVEKASASWDSTGVNDGSGIRPLNNKIYLCVISNWLSVESVNINSTYVKLNNGTLKQVDAEGSPAHSTATTKRIGNQDYPLIEVTIEESTTYIVWSRKSSGNATIDINIHLSRDGLINTYVVATNYNNDSQLGYWTYLDNETTVSDSDNLYFSPCDQWGKKCWRYNQLWPYLIIYDSNDKIIYESGASTIVEEEAIATRTRLTEDQSHYIFKFVNVPKYGTNEMYLDHSWRILRDEEDNYAILDESSWLNGNNFFLTKDKDCEAAWGGGYVRTNETYSTIFYENEAKAFLRGSFKRYSGINWSMSIGTNPSTSSAMGGIILPVEEYSFTRREFQGGFVNRISLSVEANDSFTYHTYTYLKNKHTSGSVSSWEYAEDPGSYVDDHGLFSYGYEKYTTGNITVYDEREATGASTPVANPGDYITSGDTQNGITAIKYKKSGFVELRRSVSDGASVPTLQIRFKNKFAIVGSGSFMNGDDWDITGGVQLDDDTTYTGVLKRQYLQAGDVFKITNNTLWKGYDCYTSGGSNFEETALTKTGSDAKLGITIQYEGDWWGNDGCHTRIKTIGSPIESHNEIIDLSDTYGTASIYADCTGIKFCRKNTSGEYNELTGTFPTDFSKEYYYKIYARNNQSASLVRYDKEGDYNIKCKTSGYYNIYFASVASDYEITIDTVYGDELYLDLDTYGSEWEEASAVIGAYFWNGTENTKVQMYKVHGASSSYLYEVLVPVFDSGEPTNVLFYRAENLGGSWWNQTDNAGMTVGKNIYKLTGHSGNYQGSFVGMMTYHDRALCFGTYFQSSVGCDPDGLNKPSGTWSDFSTEYGHMCTKTKDMIRDTVADEYGDAIKHALATYDYIVFNKKYSECNNFLERSQGSSGVSSGAIRNYKPYELLFGENSESATLLIIIVSSVSILSITALSVLMVKKRKQQ